MTTATTESGIEIRIRTARRDDGLAMGHDEAGRWYIGKRNAPPFGYVLRDAIEYADEAAARARWSELTETFAVQAPAAATPAIDPASEAGQQIAKLEREIGRLENCIATSKSTSMIAAYKRQITEKQSAIRGWKRVR